MTDLPAESSENFGAQTDGMERLWTPHRMVYIDDGPHRDVKTCPFCEGPKGGDEQSLIVYRGETCFVVMNLFPYNPGHVLVLPYRHIPDYTDLDFAERVEFGELTAHTMEVIRQVKAPQGFNLGMNQGAVAGAGIAGHLHQHIVPRWAGDANFFPIVARTKAVPELLGQTRQVLAEAFGDWQPREI
ncbi:histidine triad domain protein [Mobiluncus holmesii ATCC 35242]|uniref:Histidine triad domain protein n=1 Tax=Mobiluncus holmesii ATCC 35242 TaxID=887899 RepID=E6M2N5_9ACTO|nr:HIT domain-containing protein [Mobiluncus holmesii]EFU82221.1 histidine triad domain protein [Mobiluncus holmesii ATCC 35242]STY88805.1 AP-4-A phosphorylase [Mobiluncus holmesii]